MDASIGRTPEFGGNCHKSKVEEVQSDLKHSLQYPYALRARRLSTASETVVRVCGAGGNFASCRQNLAKAFAWASPTRETR